MDPYVQRSSSKSEHLEIYEPFTIPRAPSPMPEINASLFHGAYLDNAFPGTGSHVDPSFVSCLSHLVYLDNYSQLSRTLVRCSAPSQVAPRPKSYSFHPSRMSPPWIRRVHMHRRLP